MVRFKREIIYNHFRKSSVKTNRFISAFILTVSLMLLWAVPVVTSDGFNAGWFAVDLCILAVTYVMLAYPGLFSSIARRNRPPTTRAKA